MDSSLFGIRGDWRNRLYFGDNLGILREMPDGWVDLIYLDPPFNSNATYNVLFKERSGEESAAQIQAFTDTWRWGREADDALLDLMERAPEQLRDLLGALLLSLKRSDMLAYLVMMAARLVELHRVLAPTGSLYLHCDPTASHYLKIIMDAVFGPAHFLNEIIWKRTGAHGAARRFGPVHDVLLYYARGPNRTWNRVFRPHEPDYVAGKYRFIDKTGRRWQDVSLTGIGTRRGFSGRPWRGFDPTPKGRHWALPAPIVERLGGAGGTSQDKLDALDQAGLVYWPPEGGLPRFKQYLDDLPGQAVQDVWDDLSPINSQAQERLGYPTQKPEALLERIIKASSNEGDVVLDPFCGCGTTIAAAERLKRRWIGIDITHLAVNLIRHRLATAFPSDLSPFEVIGDPKDVGSAESLAHQDRLQFQVWALGLVGVMASLAGRKGADRGIDGRIEFQDDRRSGWKKVVFQVKSGHVGSRDMRDLRGAQEREKAAVAVLITLQDPTGPMLAEAAAAGLYESPTGQRFPRLQVLTVAELLDGKQPEYPRWGAEAHKAAPRRRKAGLEQQRLI